MACQFSGCFCVAPRSGAAMASAGKPAVRFTGDVSLERHAWSIRRSSWVLALLVLLLTLVITLLTKKLKTDEELKGLVYSLTPRVQDDSKYWYQKPEVMAVIVGVIAIIITIIVW